MPSFICPKEQVGMRKVMNLSLENSTYLAVFLQWDLQYKTLLPSRKEHLFKYKKYYALKAQCAFTALFSKLHGRKMKTKNWYQSCPILLTPEHDALSCDYKSSQYTFVQTKLYLTASRVLFFSSSHRCSHTCIFAFFCLMAHLICCCVNMFISNHWCLISSEMFTTTSDSILKNAFYLEQYIWYNWYWHLFWNC